MVNGHAPVTSRRGAHAARRGLVLVAAVGILGVLSVMAMTFAAVMRLEARAARNFAYSVRAEFIARAGIEDAIARLRSIARDGAELPYDAGRAASWYTWRGTAGGGWKVSFAASEATNGLDDDGDGLVDARDLDEKADELLAYTDWVSSTYTTGGDSYTLRVQDAASKVNVNAGDNLGVILDNLCRVIGPPLVAADQAGLVPKWFSQQQPAYRSSLNGADEPLTEDLFYRLDDNDRPLTDEMGTALYGDGYAIAGHRARAGAYLTIEDVRASLTWVERADGDNDGVVEADTPEERMEVEAKFAALRPYITVDSWADTDQIGYGKFEHVHTNATGSAIRLVDRNKTWNVSRNDGDGELKGCYVAIVNGLGQGQLKTIARNTIDTIFLDNSAYPGSEMIVPPSRDSSYIIIGKDHNYDTNAEEWYNEARLYAKQPLSFHRAPVNVNTATDKVLVALTLGLQTNWGPAGYYTNEEARAITGDWYSLCPSVLSIGRDGYNAFMTFSLPCPNDSTLAGRLRDNKLAAHGHARGSAPYCFFCNHGRPFGANERPGHVGEAHYIAWQILKEREQTEAQDVKSDGGRARYSNGHGPFKGWDDLYFRVFRPWERASDRELSVRPVPLDAGVPRLPGRSSGYSAALTIGSGGGSGHPGVARLLMANFNSNTDILKFQPNLEWINRWGANFTELYLPYPEFLGSGRVHMEGAADRDLKLRVKPGELLDKSDLNIGTTELSFDAGGVFEVESTGRVYDGGSMLAEKKFSALVRVYDVWRESTQREFVAGSIDDARGRGGSAMAGQVAADGVSMRKPGGGRVARKSLCTYPEPVVPGDYKGADGRPAPLSVNRRGRNVKPAGYDGQILLATNMLMKDATENADSSVTFYHSFTGQMGADVARGKATPLTTSVDEVGILGAIDNEDVDVTPTRDRRGVYIEGEGKGGDLRPDGVFLGVVGSTMQDGSFEFETDGNFASRRGVISMWVKPNWCHGIYKEASMPVSYLSDPSEEKGSTVPITKYPGWPTPIQRYTSDSQRGALGYVRERFEHEFFNATMAGTGGGAHNFSFSKAGDFQHCGISPNVWDDDRYSSPTGAMLSWIETRHDWDFWFQVPGVVHTKSNKPYFQIAPFRWNFIGLAWNYDVPYRGAFKASDADQGRIPTGTPWERGRRQGNTLYKGASYGEDPCEAGTKDKHLSLVMQGRMFVDTMRGWDTPLSGFPGDDLETRLQSWAYDTNSTLFGYGGGAERFPFSNAPSPDYFGINRARPETQHLYNRRYSGTYATVDELTISDAWPDPRNVSNEGLYWPQHRRKSGRYYFDRTGRQRPAFTSQALFDSERSQGFVFRDAERDEVIELGTVRWTVFTPYYCIHQPGLSDYTFPYDTYFIEAQGIGSTQSRVSQSWRPGPHEWRNGPRSRNSSQRGCTVSVLSGRSEKPTEEMYEYYDPEAWSPILAAGARNVHARSTPQDLKYVVRFGFSQEEYNRASADSVLLDSPVFDDITITYLRRPKILQWRDVSE